MLGNDKCCPKFVIPFPYLVMNIEKRLFTICCKRRIKLHLLVIFHKALSFNNKTNLFFDILRLKNHFYCKNLAMLMCKTYVQ